MSKKSDFDEVVVETEETLESQPVSEDRVLPYSSEWSEQCSRSPNRWGT